MSFEFDSKTLETSCQSCSLAQLCLPRGLSNDELEKLDNMVDKQKPIKRGEYLFQVGQSFTSLYAIRSGSVKVFLPTEGGEEQIVGFHMPGELLGLDAMGHKKHICSAIALETTSVCELPYDNMQDLCHHVPSLSKQFLSLVSNEIGSEHEMLLTLGKKNAEERLASFLVNLSVRFKRRGFSEQEFNLSMSRHDIANYLGLAVETVSRIFTRLQQQGILDVQRRFITIEKSDKLKKIAKSACIEPR